MIDEKPLLENEETAEEKALGSLSPIKTLLSLIPGPLISELTNAFYGVFNSFLVSKGEGAEGLEVLSSLFIFDTAVYAFGMLSSTAAASHVPYLLAKKQNNEAYKLVADLFKVVVFFGLLYPAIVIPLCKPVVVWLSGKKDVAEDSFKYICISAGCSVVTFSYHLLCGVLQGLGKTWVYASMQITALFLDMFLFLPLFLFVFKWKVWCVALSQVLSQSIPAFVMFCLLMCKKLTLDVKFSMFFTCISKETWQGIKIGVSSFILNLSEAFPAFTLQKYIMLVAARVGKLDEVLTVYSIVSRLYGLIVCVLIAFDSAYLPPASYAFGKKQYKRILKLLFHTFWMTFSWGFLAAMGIILSSRYIFSFYSKEESIIKVGSEFAFFSYATMPICCIHSLVISFLQSINKPNMATAICFITTLIPMPTLSTIFYFTVGKNNLLWIFSTYVFDDCITATISLSTAATVFYRLCKKNDGEEFSEKEEEEVARTESFETIPQ